LLKTIAPLCVVVDVTAPPTTKHMPPPKLALNSHVVAWPEVLFTVRTKVELCRTVWIGPVNRCRTLGFAITVWAVQLL
jgi:hypothetical protein